MVVSVAVTKAMTNLQEAYQNLDLRSIADPSFFSEWQGPFADVVQILMTLVDR